MSPVPQNSPDPEHLLREALIEQLPPRYDPGPLGCDRLHVRKHAGLSMREFAQRAGFHNGAADVRLFEQSSVCVIRARQLDEMFSVDDLVRLVDLYRVLIEQVTASGQYEKLQKRRDHETLRQRNTRLELERQHAQSITLCARNCLHDAERRDRRSVREAVDASSPTLPDAPEAERASATSADPHPAVVPSIEPVAQPPRSRWAPAPGSGEPLAPWPANRGDPLARYLRADELDGLALVDTTGFRGEHDPSCYARGGVSRRASGVHDYAHPCEKRTCRRCASQFAALTLGRVYALWSGLGIAEVSVYRLPLAKWETASKALRRCRGQGRGGEHVAVFRTTVVVAFTDGVLPTSFERYRLPDDGPVSVAEALELVMRALRQPQVEKGRRYSCSNGWRLPELHRQTDTSLANYVHGETKESASQYVKQLRLLARERFASDLSNLPPEEVDALAIELRDWRPELWKVPDIDTDGGP